MLWTILGSVGILGSLVAIVAGLKAYGFMDMIRSSGKNEMRAQQAIETLAVAKKQGEIMTRDETDSELDKALDDGSF